MTLPEVVRAASNRDSNGRFRRRGTSGWFIVRPCGLIECDCTCCEVALRTDDILADDWEVGPYHSSLTPAPALCRS